MQSSAIVRWLHSPVITATVRAGVKSDLKQFTRSRQCTLPLARLLLSCSFSSTSRVFDHSDSSNEQHDESSSSSSYLTVEHNADTRVVTISLNRPHKLNALDDGAWHDIRQTFDACDTDPTCRAIVLHGGDSKHFCAGIDLQAMQELSAKTATGADAARNAYRVLPVIKRYQDALSAIERCRKPVIAAVHGACVGAGIDMICAADIRYCSADAYFQIKEVDIGLAADVGTLQRFPKQIGNDSLTRELAFTARRFHADEALRLGFISRIVTDRQHLLRAATDIALTIVSKSPVAVQGTKINLNYSRDHTVEEGLEFMRAWNMGMLQTEDSMKSAMRAFGRKKAAGQQSHESASDFKDV